MKRLLAAVTLATAALLVHEAAASPRGWDPDKKSKDRMHADETVQSFRTPELAGYFDEAYGYAVFPTVGKAALVVGGSYGTGRVYEMGRFVGDAKISGASIGFQIGGESYSEIIFFHDREAFDRFKRGDVTLQAGATATAAKATARLETTWNGGVAVFTRTKGGLMASAAVGGQKLEFEPR